MMILPLTVFPLSNTQGVVPKSIVLVTKVPGVIGVPNAGTLVTVAQLDMMELGSSVVLPFKVFEYVLASSCATISATSSFAISNLALICASSAVMVELLSSSFLVQLTIATANVKLKINFFIMVFFNSVN